MSVELLERPPALVQPPPPSPPEARDGGGGGGNELFGDPDRFGLLAFLATLSMMFIGFTSAYMVRRAGADWRALEPPSLMWANTLVLVASSFALERSRRLLRAGERAGCRGWLAMTGALGGVFVGGQVAAWSELAERGVFLASNPHSSFVYLLSGLHAVHVLSALAWFAIVLARGTARLSSAPDRDGLRLFALYWHFLGVLWAYLFVLLFFL